MKPLLAQTEPLTVVMRVRPMNTKEYKSAANLIVQPVDDKFLVFKDPHEDMDDVLRVNRSREKHYIFDHVFPTVTTQEDVYETVIKEKGIIDAVLSGFNCTVFAYGATGTGKTHTMLGSRDKPGIMVHTLNDLFRRMEETSHDRTYTVSIGYLEIYNENVRDLLCPDSGSLELREDANGSIIISNLLDISAKSTEVVLGMLRMGNTNRTSEPTVANATSSRSHAILKVNVEQHSRVSNVMQESHCGSLYLVDLAGSERAAVTQNRGKRLQEGAHINRSLLALANCINALGCNGSSYINYRDSKLTRILKEALGGNCKTIMIAHVSPASTSYEDTRNTMVYAERSKKIRNKARQNVVDVNYHVTQYVHIINELNHQIARLKGQLNRAEVGGSLTEDPSVAHLCDRLKSTVLEQKELRTQLLEIECALLQNTMEGRKHHAFIQDWESSKDSLDLTSSTAPPSTEPPSPSFTQCTHPLATDSTNTDPLNSQIYPVHPSTSEAHLSLKVQQQCGPLNVESQSFADSISLKQAGNVMSTSVTPQNLQDKSCCSVASNANTDTGDELAVVFEVCAGKDSADGAKETKSDEIRSDIPLLKSHLAPLDYLTISPDSGAESLTTAPCSSEQEAAGEVGRVEMAQVQAAKEELSVLQAKRHRMEKERKMLRRKLRNVKEEMIKINETLSSSEGLLPTRKEVLDLLLLTNSLEASSTQHSFSSTLVKTSLSQQTSLVHQLLEHSASLLELLERQRLLAEDDVMKNGDLCQQLGDVSERQKRLAAQVAEMNVLSNVGTEKQITSGDLKLLFKLYNVTTESKASSFEDGTQSSLSLHSLTSSSSDFHLLPLPSSSLTNPPGEKLSKSNNTFSLPAINATSRIVTAAQPSTNLKPFLPRKKCSKTSTSSNSTSPLKKSEIHEIVEAAKKSRDRRNNAPSMAPAMKLQNSKKTKATSTTVTTRRQDQHRGRLQGVPSHSLVLRHDLPPPSAVVIDLEANNNSDAFAASDSSHPTDSTDSFALAKKSQSQPHLHASLPPLPPQQRSTYDDYSINKEEKGQRGRTHARNCSISSSKSLPGTTSKKKHIVTQQTLIGTRDADQWENSRWAETKKCWSTASKPVVKKIAFNTQQLAECVTAVSTLSSGGRDNPASSGSLTGNTAQHQKQLQSPTTTKAKKKKNVQGNSKPRVIKTRNPFLLPPLPRKHLTVPKVALDSQISSLISPYLQSLPMIYRSGDGCGSTKKKPFVKKRNRAKNNKKEETVPI